ncbi:hypothetical protein LTS18_002128, partial [Coniosporium uncinatum]
MLFKSLNLARQSLVKTFQHGTAQTLVAASQSSQIAQSHPFGNFSKQVNAKRESHQHALPGQHQPTAGLKPGQHDPTDSGLAAYYAAWQKHQKVGEHEWQQFQFRKRIEFNVHSKETEVSNKQEPAVAEDVSEGPALPERAGVERAYSTSAVDDFRRVIGIEEEANIAKVDAAIAEEIIKAKDAASLIDTTQSETVSHTLSPKSADTLQSSLFSEDTKATSVLEFGHFAEQLQVLAAEQQYAEIPAVFEHMLASNVKPTSYAYNALLLAAINLPRAKHQVVPKALDVYSDMLRRK